MSFAANAERGAPGGEDMATLTYEEGLEEIDSFFNSSPDGCNTTVEENVDSSELDNSGAPIAQDTAASASSTVRTQDPAKPENREDVLHEPDKTTGTSESVTPMEDYDQVAASERMPAQRGSINFILNNVTRSPPKVARPGPTSEDSIVGEVDDTGAQDPSSLQSIEKPHPTKGKPSATSSEAIDSSPTKTTDVIGFHGPHQSHPHSRFELIPAPLPSFHAERGLALLSPSRGLPIEPSRPSATKSPSKDIMQSSPPLLPSLPHEDDLPSAALLRNPTNDAAMSGHPVPPQSSPVAPSSAGKSSLLEEMRNEEEESAGMIRSQAGRMRQPDLAAGGTKDQSSQEGALSGHQIVDGANTNQQKANLLITNRGEVKPSPDVSDITVAEETDEAPDGIEDVNRDMSPLSKPDDKVKNKVQATKDTKTTENTTAQKQQAKPIPQLGKSSRNQPKVQQDEAAADEADDEPELKPFLKPTVPAKRKANAPLAPQNKRAKNEGKTTIQVSEGSATEKSEPARATKTMPSRIRPKGGQPLGGYERKNLGDAWTDLEKVPTGPRQTRGQKEEAEKKLPNAGRAAKERHKKKSD